MPAYVLYARKSTESDDRQALSIDAQVNELTEHADKNGLDIRQVYKESKSAKKSGRPVFNEMLRALKRERGFGVLCWKLDRLTRNLVDGAVISEALETGVISEIRTPTQTYRNNSTDKFMTHLDFIMAKKYIDDLSENVKRGLRAKLQMGWRPGPAPLGYRNDPMNFKGQKTISLDPERAPLVRKMWDLMLTGRYSIMEILRKANDEWGFRTPRHPRMPSGPLSRSNLYRIFTDPFYCGRFEFAGELHIGKHPPIVTPEEFDRVQELMGRVGKPRPKRHAFTFRGLIQCGQCGGMVTAEEKFKNIKGTEERRRYIYYHCGHRKDPNCRQRSITEHELRAQVDNFLAGLTIPKEIVAWALKYLNQVAGKERVKQAAQTETLQKELRAIDAKLQNLLALRIAPENHDGQLLSDSEYLAQKNRLTREKLLLESKLEGAESQDRMVVELTAETFRLAAYARAWFRHGDAERQRTVLAAVGSNRTFLDKKLLMSATKPLQIIERHVLSTTPHRSGFEPKNLGSANIKTAPRGGGSDNWLRTMDEVRTAIRRMLANGLQVQYPAWIQSTSKPRDLQRREESSRAYPQPLPLEPLSSPLHGYHA
jgi:DNA invertase Pin-like site-specific DNA recombinase/predicted metal-binding protein